MFHVKTFAQTQVSPNRPHPAKVRPIRHVRLLRPSGAPPQLSGTPLTCRGRYLTWRGRCLGCRETAGVSRPRSANGFHCGESAARCSCTRSCSGVFHNRDHPIRPLGRKLPTCVGWVLHRGRIQHADSPAALDSRLEKIGQLGRRVNPRLEKTWQENVESAWRNECEKRGKVEEAAAAGSAAIKTRDESWYHVCQDVRHVAVEHGKYGENHAETMIGKIVLGRFFEPLVLLEIVGLILPRQSCLLSTWGRKGPTGGELMKAYELLVFCRSVYRRGNPRSRYEAYRHHDR